MIAYIILALIGILILLQSIVIVLNLMADRANRLMREAYEKEFPDRCFVCFHHHHGVEEGWVDPKEPVPVHQCKERANFGWRRR